MSNVPQGVILYQGPSLLDGKPIVAIATGLRTDSSNRKTGAMVQVYILRADEHPISAIQTGDDRSVCGDCPLRGIVVDGHNVGRRCYVAVFQGPAVVWKAYHRGLYPMYRHAEHATLFADRQVRFGTYGDPCAVPYWVWRMLASICAGYTGYTHVWRNPRVWRYRAFLMASVESADDARDAQRRGWRTFRILKDRGEIGQLEIICPASDEGGKRTTCEQCGACNGRHGTLASSANRRRSIAIVAHGSPPTIANWSRVG